MLKHFGYPWVHIVIVWERLACFQHWVFSVKNDALGKAIQINCCMESRNRFQTESISEPRKSAIVDWFFLQNDPYLPLSIYIFIISATKSLIECLTWISTSIWTSLTFPRIMVQEASVERPILLTTVIWRMACIIQRSTWAKLSNHGKLSSVLRGVPRDPNQFQICLKLIFMRAATLRILRWLSSYCIVIFV